MTSKMFGYLCIDIWIYKQFYFLKTISLPKNYNSKYEYSFVVGSKQKEYDKLSVKLDQT